MRTNNTKNLIKKAIDGWDVEKQGKVTQKKLAEVSGKNIKTINKYYRLFKEIINGINERYRDSQ